MSILYVMDWLGEFDFEYFFTSTASKYNVSGVYMIIEIFPNNKGRINHVGKTESSLKKRIQDHYLQIIGGLKIIPKEYRSQSNDWNPNWNHKYYRDVILDEHKFQGLIKESFNFVNLCKIYLHIPKWGDLRNIQKNLIHDLQPAGMKILHSLPKDRFDIKHKNPKWRNIKLRNQFSVKDIFID